MTVSCRCTALIICQILFSVCSTRLRVQNKLKRQRYADIASALTMQERGSFTSYQSENTSHPAHIQLYTSMSVHHQPLCLRSGSSKYEVRFSGKDHVAATGKERAHWLQTLHPCLLVHNNKLDVMHRLKLHA